MQSSNLAADPQTRLGGDVAAEPEVATLDGMPVHLRYWEAVKRWRWIIAGVVAGCLALGLVVTLLMQPLYTAGSRIEISRAQKNITNVPGIEPGTDPYDSEFYDTQYALLRSESLALRVARNLRLASDPAFFAAHGVEIGDLPKPGTPAAAAGVRQREEMAAGLLLANLGINPIRNSSLVNIDYTSQSPTMSAKVANAWPREFIGSTIDRQFATTADARNYLEERLNALRVRLAQSENDLISFSNAHNLVKLGASRDASGNTQEPRTLVTANLEGLNDALLVARTERIAAESKARTGGSNSSDVLQNASFIGLRAKRSEVAAEYARMLVQFEPAYPAAQALKGQLDALDAAIAGETARIVGSSRAAYREAVARERELAAQVNAEKARFDEQQRATIQYNVLQREVDTNRQLYDALLQRYKEIGVAGNVGATNIAIVDPAKVPGGPSSPNLGRNVALALLIGLVLAAAAVLALEQMDEGIRDPHDVERKLRMPLLGIVPASGGEVVSELIDSKSPLAESYVSARTALQLATSHGFPKSVVVTSAEPGEGKSVTALALAAAVGRAGKSVLLIDGDMRSPIIHAMLGEANGPGFSNLLSGEEHQADLIHRTSLPGVSVLLSGPVPPSASDLLSTDRLAALLEGLSRRYDHIVVDAPPIIGLADAPLLAGAVEGSIVVVEAERTSVRSVRHAIRRLNAANGRPFGAIVTKVAHGQLPYGYGYAYGYGSQQRQAEDARAA
jgi:capsular exopolysaccharide synthesis family protein